MTPLVYKTDGDPPPLPPDPSDLKNINLQLSSYTNLETQNVSRKRHGDEDSLTPSTGPKKRAPRSHALSPIGYDKLAHQAVIGNIPTPSGNGVALNNGDLKKLSPSESLLLQLSSKKKQCWFKFCESLNLRSSPSLVWKSLMRFRRSFDDNNRCFSAEWLEHFAHKLASPPSVPHSNLFPVSPLTISPDKMDSPFSISDLHCALNGLKDSTPGEDGVIYSF
ncbi:hypothetical protein KGM_216008 [Danaus plexippus plexippus]|uniref:Uncharacterized protein n=1 Tax=Danaus plexippus plexippus TaxID=278856 RepID=A0A212EM08_DANPL|nr:hypothetical protein KGM_216008 [Danaus plexippus plexippus]